MKTVNAFMRKLEFLLEKIRRHKIIFVFAQSEFGKFITFKVLCHYLFHYYGIVKTQ